jgi:TM2 domain-containing membrane protein YozV
MYCKNCGNKIREEAVYCIHCGSVVGGEACANTAQKSKVAAGLFGILLGGFGVHSFYLGFVGKGIAQICLTIFCFGAGGIWGLIEGILILTGSIDRDAAGVPLRD